jgi:hypothetical protein
MKFIITPLCQDQIVNQRLAVVTIIGISCLNNYYRQNYCVELVRDSFVTPPTTSFSTVHCLPVTSIGSLITFISSPFIPDWTAVCAGVIFFFLRTPSVFTVEDVVEAVLAFFVGGAIIIAL